ncbi:extracellular solute-binding protein [Brevibacterium luteolum]|uniref:extracellular solute-binding protein n=1 Tax=Brevibacterium luteolum TaxID=199591 RepID=UPI00223C1A2C|nr:extracellular solute-binding protein [Brevibacterium luteolum]MCT1873675.1 extracellular solute-binding protein [Brevibacterium luteolum]MCT1890895.1 extracellular solute-binding protein [Brevibacterium luteolum]MCT1893441.1 extracellular solute-binding protein [Brevibacterium luteolum]MCT1924171.1 extracellular solute-binding protein [Brevibacterium luteolum]
MTDPSRRRRTRLLAGAAMATATLMALSGCGTQEDAKTLTWYIDPDNGGKAAMAEACTEASGGKYTIQTSMLPSDAAGQREQLIRRLASKDNSIDIMSIDTVYVPEFANADFIAPVPEEYVDEFTDDVVEAAVESSMWEDQLVVAPVQANTQILWYRKSVAEAAGLDMEKPVTWDQIIEAAKDQDKEIGAQGIRAESLTVWVNALYESQGEPIVKDPEAEPEDTELGLDSPAGAKAAEIVDTIGSEGLGGPNFSNLDEQGAMLRFQGENGGFMVNWPFVYPAMKAAVEDGSLDQEVFDDVGWAQYPAVEDGTPGAAPLGGGKLAVGAFSDHQDEAFEAISCIRETEKQSEYYITDGLPPATRAAFDDPKVQEEAPYSDAILDSLEVAKSRPISPYYNGITGGIQRSWHPPADVSPQSTPKTSADLILEILRGEALL